MTALLALLALLGCGPDASRVVRQIHSDNPVVREDMVVLARRYRDPEILEALAEVLDDPSEAIRLEAVESLATLGHPNAVPHLVHRLDVETSTDVRREIIDALGRLGDDRALDPLLDLARSSPVDEVPLNVIWALGRIGDRRAMPILVRLREEATDAYVVYNVNVALRQLR